MGWRSTATNRGLGPGATVDLLRLTGLDSMHDGDATELLAAVARSGWGHSAEGVGRVRSPVEISKRSALRQVGRRASSTVNEFAS